MQKRAIVTRFLIYLFAFSLFVNLYAQPKINNEKRFNVVFMNAPVATVANYLTLQSGKSVVLSSQIKGRISVNLTNVTIDEAVENIASSYGWKWVKTDENTYMIMTEKEYIDWQKTQTIDKVFEVKHITASEAMQLLKTKLSKVGKIAADDRTGKIFVTDIPSAIQEISKLLQEIDVPVVTRIFNLKNALPSDIEKQIKNFISKRGKISTNDRLRQIIVTDLPENIKKIESVIEEMDSDTEIRIFKIKYLSQSKDDKQLDKLKKAIEPLLTPKKSYLQVDERTSTIIVKDVPSVLDKVAQVIEAYDQPPKEVFIIARLYRISLLKQGEYGIQYQRIYPKTDLTPMNSFTYNGNTFSLNGNIDEVLRYLSLVGDTTNIVFIKKNLFEVLIKMLDNYQNTETLIRPQILVKNHQKAKIQSGGEEPYRVEYNYNDSNNTSYSQRTIEYGIVLEVTPHINQNDLINMEIKFENSKPTFTVDSKGRLVGKVKDEFQTYITLPSGKAVIIGGMLDNTFDRRRGGIPILSEIPLIGPLLFGNKTNKNDKKQLFLFLSARVIDFEKDLYNSSVSTLRPEDVENNYLKNFKKSELEKSQKPLTETPKEKNK